MKVSSRRRAHELVANKQTPQTSTKTTKTSIIKQSKDVSRKVEKMDHHHVGKKNVVTKEDWQKLKHEKIAEIEKKNSPDFMIGGFFSKIYNSIFD